jgi:hypothetical protein
MIIIPPWIFVICIIANTLLAGISILNSAPNLLVTNVLSALICGTALWINTKLKKEDED